MLGPTLVLTVAKATTLTFGGVVTVTTVRAYRRTGSTALLALTVGIGLVTAGATLGGPLHELFEVRLEVSVSAGSVVTAVGFGVLTYSLYAGRPRPALRAVEPRLLTGSRRRFGTSSTARRRLPDGNP